MAAVLARLFPEHQAALQNVDARAGADAARRPGGRGEGGAGGVRPVPLKRPAGWRCGRKWPSRHMLGISSTRIARRSLQRICVPAAPARSSTNSRTNRYPRLGARLWHGMPLPALVRLLRVGGLGSVELRHWPMLASAMVSGLVNSALGGIQRATHGARIAELRARPAAALHPRPLALGHDAPARAPRPRRAAQGPDEPGVLRADPLPRQRPVSQKAQIPAARQAADGRHGFRLAAAAGGRVRPDEHGLAVGLPADRLPEQSADRPGDARFRRRAGGGAGALAGGAAAVREDAWRCAIRRSGSC